MNIETAVETLRKALKNDPDLAHTWFCNVAMSFYDSMPKGEYNRQMNMANAGARTFMKRAFGVDCHPRNG